MLTPYNFDVYRGERATLQFAMSPARAILPSETHTFAIAKKENSTTKILGPTAIVFDNPASGLAHFTLLPTDTDLSPAVYYWDVWRADNGFESVEAKGTLTILADTTVPPVI